MNPHPHAEVLRAIADGVPLSEFELTLGGGYRKMINLDWFWEPTQYAIRRKPQYIMVNGFKVPKPLDVAPSDDAEYFIVALLDEDLHDCFRWYGTDKECRWLDRKVIHATKEAAIAHAKAMLGIDPAYLDDQLYRKDAGGFGGLDHLPIEMIEPIPSVMRDAYVLKTIALGGFLAAVIVGVLYVSTL
jgi:hypothetical protein